MKLIRLRLPICGRVYPPPPPSPRHTHPPLVPPEGCDCLTSQKSDPAAPLCPLPQAPANLSPLLWASIWKVRRDRRAGRGGPLSRIDLVTDTTVALSDIREMCRLFFNSARIQYRCPHTLCVCLSLWAFSAPFCLDFSRPLCPSFISFFNCTHTDYAHYDVCTAGLDSAVQETCGLQIPC